MIPTPFEEFIPKFFKRDNKLQALANKIDEYFNSAKNEIIGIERFRDPLSTPDFIEELALLLNADILPGDGDRTKREKVATAVQSHKNRGSFKLDAKPKIDAIAGGDSQIFQSVGISDWILVGDGNTPLSFYWASLGVDNIDGELGLDLIGGGDEAVVAGNIYIDVDNNSLTTGQQEQIRLSMEDVVPAYYRVHFGYIDGAGVFQTYFIME